MSKKDNPQIAAYCRVGTKEQLMSDSDRKYMMEWTEICSTYCNKVGAELLFVNQGDFGCIMPTGELRHIYADELAVILATEQPFGQALDENAAEPTLSM